VRDQFVHAAPAIEGTYPAQLLTSEHMADHVFHSDDVDVQPDEVRRLHDAGEIQLVDVREPYEWEAGRIAGARHIELEHIASSADTIDRERPVVFYCRVGARSGMAANAFRRAGYDAYSIDGGITAWDERGLPLEPADGQVAPH
jgi:rhodanese-related sulfurtransferase